MSKSSSNRRFVWLDFARGFCALQVAAYHFFPGNNLLQFNWLFVDLFFILSGFVLYPKIPMYASEQKAHTKFIRSRILRFVPLLVIALAGEVLLVLASVVEGEKTRQESIESSVALLPNLFFLQFLVPGSILLLVPLWSLTTEFWINAITSLFTLHKSISRIVMLICVGLSLIVLSIFLNTDLIDFSGYSIWLFLFGRTFYGFGLGLLLGALVLNFRLQVRFKSGLLMACIIILLCVSVNNLEPDLLVLPSSILFAAMIYLLYRIPNPPELGKVEYVCTLLGLISFGIYVLHPNLFIIGNRLIGTSLNAPTSFTIQIMLMIPCVWLINSFVEPRIRSWLAKLILPVRL